MAANCERTFIAIKPDGVQRGLVGEIIKRFEQKGFRLVAMKFLQVRLWGNASPHPPQQGLKSLCASPAAALPAPAGGGGAQFAQPLELLGRAQLSVEHKRLISPLS